MHSRIEIVIFPDILFYYLFFPISSKSSPKGIYFLLMFITEKWKNIHPWWSHISSVRCHNLFFSGLSMDMFVYICCRCAANDTWRFGKWRYWVSVPWFFKVGSWFAVRPPQNCLFALHTNWKMGAGGKKGFFPWIQGWITFHYSVINIGE